MPAIDTGGAHVTPKRKPSPRIRVPVTPDQRDRQRSPAQKASDRRVVNRTIETAQTRARVTPDQADRMRSVAQRAHDAEVVRRTVASSREKALGKRGRGSGTRAVKRITKDIFTQGIQANEMTMANTGAGPTAWVPVKGGGGGMHFAAMTAAPHAVHVDDKTFAGRFALDGANIGGGVLPSLFIPAAGTYEALRSGGKDTKRLRKFGKDFAETDPLFNAGKAGVQAAAGNTKGAKKSINKAIENANKHPGFAALEVASLRAPLGRGAGGLVRTTGKATGVEAIKRLGSTERAAKTLPGTNLAQPRRYSKNLIDKGAAAGYERWKGRGSRKFAKKAAKETDEGKRAELQAKSRARDPLILRDREINKRIDAQHSIAEGVRRINQKDVAKAETKELKKARKGGPVASLLAQRITKPTLASLRDYRDALVKIQKDLAEQPAKLSDNKQLVGDLSKAIKRIEKGKVSLDDLKGIADRYTGRNLEYQAQLEDRGVYDAEQQQRRAALPHAVLHEGVHKDPEYLAAQTRATRKEASKTSKTAATSRGKALSRQSTHKRETAADVAQQEARPLREPSALEALKKEHEAQAKARKKQVKASKTRAKKATEKAQTASDAHVEAERLQRIDPFLKTRGKGKSQTKTPLSAAEYKAMLEGAHGTGAKAAIISQAPRQTNAFYRSGLEPVTGETMQFSGKAVKEGTLDASPEAMARQNIRSQTIADAVDNYTDLIDQTSRRYIGAGDKVVEDFYAKRGKKAPAKGEALSVKDKLDADQLARDLSAHGDVTWRAVRKTAVRAPDAQKLDMEENINRGVVNRSTVQGALSGEGEGPWAIIPEAAAKRVQSHLDALSPSDFDRLWRAGLGGFGRVVLAGSPGWPTGNVTEGLLRSALNRVGPRSWWTGRKMTETWDQKGQPGVRAKAATIGGGHFGLADRTIHNNVSAFEDGLARDMLKGAKIVRSLPPTKQLAWVWDHYADAVFRANKFAENQIQTAMLGRAARELLLDDKAFKLSKEAMKQAAEGGLDPNMANALSRELDRMYGRYANLSPAEREAIQRLSPFAMWARNAAEFLVTAPIRHPVATGAAAAANNATVEERKGWYNGKPLPGWLRGSVPFDQLPSDAQKLAKKLGMQPGGNFRVSRFTPLGVATDPLGTAGGLVLPQLHSTVNALFGLDWKNQPLKGTGPGGEVTEEDKGYAAVQALMGSTVPMFGVGQRTQAKGPGSLLQQAVGYSPPGKNKGRGGGAVKPGFNSGGFNTGGFSSGQFSTGSFK